MLSGLLPAPMRTVLAKATAKETNRMFLSGASSAFAVKSGGALLTFVTQVLLARMLGVREYGFFAYATSWMVLLAIPAQLGMRDSLVRFIPEYEVSGNYGLLRGILCYAMIRVAFAAIATSLLFAGGIHLFANRGADGQVLALWMMLPVLPVFALNQIREAGLRAFRRVARAFLPEHIIRPIVLCAACGMFFCVNGTLTAWQAWIFNLAAFVLAFAVGSVWLWRAVPVEAHRADRRIEAGRWLRVSLPMLLMTGMNVLLAQSGVVFLGFFAAPSEVGIYAVCARVVILVNFALTSVNAIAGPMISRLYHSGKQGELQRMLTLAARAIFGITVVASLFIGLAGEQLLGLFGPEFVRGYTPLLILMIGQIVNAFAGSVALIMNMTGHQNSAAGILGIAVILNTAGNLLLIPAHGANGAAVSSTIAMAAWNLLMLVYVRVKLKFNPTVICR